MPAPDASDALPCHVPARLHGASGNELVHRVQAYRHLLDEADALNRFGGLIWSVAREVELGTADAVDSLCRHGPLDSSSHDMLTAPRPKESPPLFQVSTSCRLMRTYPSLLQIGSL
jgi:hypothetical protein